MSATADRTTYAREYARRTRYAKWATAAADATTCPAMLARGRPCKTPLQSRFVNGETVPFCPTCERKRHGICTDCHTEPVAGTVGKALRCALCMRLARHEAESRYRAIHGRTKRAKARQYARDHTEERRAYKRLYRKIKPTRVAQWKRESYERNREKALAYHREYNAKRAAEKREHERLRNAGQLPPRTCLTCETVLTGRPKRCDPCKNADRKAAREAISQMTLRAA